MPLIFTSDFSCFQWHRAGEELAAPACSSLCLAPSPRGAGVPQKHAGPEALLPCSHCPTGPPRCCRVGLHLLQEHPKHTAGASCSGISLLCPFREAGQLGQPFPQCPFPTCCGWCLQHHHHTTNKSCSQGYFYSCPRYAAHRMPMR